MGSKIKKSKDVKLSHFKKKQGSLIKEQYKVTLPVSMIRELGWKKADTLKVWINPKKHLEIRKKS